MTSLYVREDWGIVTDDVLCLSKKQNKGNNNDRGNVKKTITFLFTLIKVAFVASRFSSFLSNLKLSPRLLAVSALVYASLRRFLSALKWPTIRRL